MRELLSQLTLALEQGRDCVYCSVVETRGSTPQKAGAAMLVFADGRQVGTLGGGCVEAEVKRQALTTLSSCGESKSEVLTFCLDDNYGWDDGLICGGRMTILADPISHPSPSGRGGGGEGERLKQVRAYYEHFRKMVEAGAGCTEAVAIAPEVAPIGSRYLFDGAGELIDQLGQTPGTVVLGLVVGGLIPLERRPKPSHQHGVAYLPVLPRITLLIVGGGHVGQAVAKLGADLDFDVWVLDDRDAYANRERFPSASRHIVGDIGQKLRALELEISPSIYALIVTRGHGHDEEALYHLATTQAGYVGMIGSKRKIKLIFEDLLARGISQASLEKVHAPLGFDIGSQTVPEIAVSIVAELIACRNRGGTISEARVRVNL
ncbi:MAG: XdhC/CoxI family protein [Gemmataceae bacterium]|nr:XdhC/CoxI family protein [Gemmataceae bacterium]